MAAAHESRRQPVISLLYILPALSSQRRAYQELEKRGERIRHRKAMQRRPMHPGDRCKRCGDTRANCVDAEASFTTAVHKGSWECHVDSISATAGTPATAAKEKGLPLPKHTGHGVTGMAP